MKLKSLLPVFLLLLSTSLFSQSYEGRIIDRINFEGLKQVSRNELNTITNPYLNKPYSESLFNELQSSLYSLGYFEGLIDPEFAEMGSNRMVITFKVQERPFITSINYKGNNVFWKDDLDKALPFRRGDPYESTLVRVAEEDIIREFATKGYLETKVKSDITFSDNQSVSIIFDIEQGDKFVVTGVQIQGVTKFSEKKVAKKIASKVDGLFSNGAFKEENLPLDAAAIEKYYQDNGYLDARVISSSFQITENPAKKRKDITLLFSVEEGILYEYGGIYFEGNTIFSDEELNRLIKHPKGIFKKDKFEEDLGRVQQLYADSGYIFNSYKEDSTLDGNVIYYTLQIQEAPQAHVGSLTVEGNKKTKEHVILREIPLETGDFFGVEALRAGLMNLRNLRYFSNVVPDIQPDPDNPGLVDVNLQVEEQGSADVQLGLTFTASADNAFPISFFTKWTERNFLGEGYTFGVGLNLSASEQSLEVSFEDYWLKGVPWFWGVSFSTSHSILATTQDINAPIFNDKQEVPDPYESWDEYMADDGARVNTFMNYGLWSNVLTGRTGYTFRTYLGRFTLSGALSIGLNYVYYDDITYRPSNYYLRDNLNTFRFENTLGFTAAWDTRDYYIAPQRGFRLAQSVSFTGGFLFGQVAFTKLTTSFENYWRFFDWAPFGEDNWHWKFILKTKMTYTSILAPLGNNFEMELQPKHRLFVAESFGDLRGWGLMKDFYSTLTANITISMPLWESIIWWDVAFLDIFVGSKNPKINVFDRGIGNYYFSFGTGIRSVIQQLPLSIAWVKPFSFYDDGTYRDRYSYNNFWKGWRLVVSLSVTT